MRHRSSKKHLSRDTTSRKALFKNLATSLIQSGQIETTETKAKVIKGLVDKLIHRAKEGSITTRRVLAQFFGRRDVVNELVDKVAPAMKDRESGFTRIVRTGKRRGDNTMMVKIELVNNPYKEEKTAKPTVAAEKKEVAVQAEKPKPAKPAKETAKAKTK